MNIAETDSDRLNGQDACHYIGGKLVSGSGQSLPIVNPATGQRCGEVAVADADIVDAALDAAGRAFPAWRDTPPHRRAQVMFRFRQLLERESDTICALITREHGKVLSDARGELARGMEIVEYACGVSELIKGEHSPHAGPGIDSWSQFQPLGLVAGITPFNFPAMVPMWMYPLALVCGNCFLLKPSERDPAASLFIARLLQEAGLPDGVFNVVNGDRSTAELLIDDPRIAAVSFVGSTPAAESIYRRATHLGKRVQALGGAKNHAVLMPDADIDNAVSALMGAAYGSCGERCMAISVVVCVGDALADRVVAELEPRVRALKIGNGTDPDSDMGPLISEESRARVRRYLAAGAEAGARLVVDGREAADLPEQGFFIGASLFDEVKPDMSIYRDEIFGPVLCVLRVESLDEAIALVNDHEYGNGSCLFTRDGEAARYFSERVQIGMVGINVALPVPIASQSFGGWKRSLFGDLYVYGPDAIRFYTRRKTVTQRWPSKSLLEGAAYSFPGR